MGLQLVKLLDNPVTITLDGLNYLGAYSGATAYVINDVVTYDGSSYVAIQNTTANLPTNTTYWQVIAEKGATGDPGADGLTVSVNSVTQVAGDISLTQDNIPDGTTNKAYTATEQSKLAGIEALADVTDTANVTSAGAVMDGDFSANGVMTRTAAGTYTSRTITGTANQVTVTNGDGVGGNPTLSLPSAITLPGTLTITGHTSPQADSTYTLGTSSLYWKETYTDKLFLNSTATLDGSTAGKITFTGHLASASNYGSDLGTTGGAFSTVRAGVFRADYSVGLSFSAGSNIQFDTATGTKIGTATNQKLGFFNAVPVVKPSSTPANATDLATALTLVNDLKSKLITLGLIA